MSEFASSLLDVPGSVLGSGIHKGEKILPAKSLQLCLTLCNPMDCSLPGFSVHGILQARILEGLPMSPALADVFFITNATWELQRTWNLYTVYDNERLSIM